MDRESATNPNTQCAYHGYRDYCCNVNVSEKQCVGEDKCTWNLRPKQVKESVACEIEPEKSNEYCCEYYTNEECFHPTIKAHPETCEGICYRSPKGDRTKVVNPHAKKPEPVKEELCEYNTADRCMATLTVAHLVGCHLNKESSMNCHFRVKQKVREEEEAALEAEAEKGAKHDTTKLRVDLYPFTSLLTTATIVGYGANEYGERNWEQGIEYSRVFTALLRHLILWWYGIEVDDESHLSHIDHAGTNMDFLQHFNVFGNGIDDRPKVGEAMQAKIKELFNEKK